MAAIELVAGDTGTVLTVTIKNKTDSAVKDLTGASVKLKYRIDAGTLVTKDMTVASPPSLGKASYQFGTGELTADVSGESNLRYEVEVTDSGGKITTQLVPITLPIRTKV